MVMRAMTLTGPIFMKESIPSNKIIRRDITVRLAARITSAELTIFGTGCTQQHGNIIQRFEINTVTAFKVFCAGYNITGGRTSLDMDIGIDYL